MKIVANCIDPRCKCGSLKLIPHNSDDIYHLSSTIAPNDKVSSQTTRKVSLDGGKTQQKKFLWLEIKVVSVETDLDVGVMYVKGKTCTENEFVRIGSHHTIDITIGNEFQIYKSEWKNAQITKIKECCKVDPELCFVIFFEKDCVISTVSSNEIKNVYKEAVKNKNFKDFIAKTINLKPNVKTIVIGATTDIGTEFHRALIKQDPSIAGMTTVIKLTGNYKGISNAKVISRLLGDKNILSAVQNVKFVDDLREAEKFFKTVDMTKEDICIGLNEVSEAMDYGAIKILFVTDRFCKPRSVGEREFADAFVKRATDLRAKVCILPIGLEFGERLELIGSVACSLSFAYKEPEFPNNKNDN